MVLYDEEHFRADLAKSDYLVAWYVLHTLQCLVREDMEEHINLGGTAEASPISS